MFMLAIGLSVDVLFPDIVRAHIAIDLMEKMLVFNPRKRLSVEDCLKHPYLKALHNEAQEVLHTFLLSSFPVT